MCNNLLHKGHLATTVGLDGFLQPPLRMWSRTVASFRASATWFGCRRRSRGLPTRFRRSRRCSCVRLPSLRLGLPARTGRRSGGRSMIRTSAGRLPARAARREKSIGCRSGTAPLTIRIRPAIAARKAQIKADLQNADCPHYPKAEVEERFWKVDLGWPAPALSANIGLVHVNAVHVRGGVENALQRCLPGAARSVRPSRDRSPLAGSRDLGSKRGDGRLSLLRASHEQSPLIGLVQPFQELLYPVPAISSPHPRTNWVALTITNSVT